MRKSVEVAIKGRGNYTLKYIDETPDFCLSHFGHNHYARPEKAVSKEFKGYENYKATMIALHAVCRKMEIVLADDNIREKIEQVLKDWKRYNLIQTIVVDTWFERDRASVIVYKDDSHNEVIAEWWDEDVSDLVEMGFLSPKNWCGSAIEYCKHMELI